MKDFNEVRERVEMLNIIDDTLFQKMAEDIGFCEEMISTVMNEKVKVTQVIPQDSIKNLQGRSVIVDALCEKQDGTFINVEVQKSNNDNHQKRVRYNASCITANITEPGTRFEKIPNVIIIYISQFDMFQSKQAIYHVDRTVRETNLTVYNGMEEIYVNAQVKGESDLTELMRIYTNTDAYNYERFPNTSTRKAHFKNNQEGVGKMCDIVEEFAKEYAKEYAEEYAKEYAEEYAKEYAEEYAKEYAEEQSKLAFREAEEKMAGKLLKEGMLTEKIASLLEVLTAEDVEKLKSVL